MAQMYNEKTDWERTMWFNQEHGQLISTLKILFQNISEQLYNHPFIPNFEIPEFQEGIYDMRNLTVAPLLGSFKMRDPLLEYTLETVILLKTLLQYYATFVIILFGVWVFNKLMLKSHIITVLTETIGSYLIFIPVLPPIVAFFATLLTFRMGIWTYLKIFYNSKDTKKISLLTPVDSFWAYESYASCSSCVGLYVIEGSCDPEKVRQRIKKTVESDLVGGKMSRKLISILGFPCWEVMDKMDIEDHVKVVLDSGSPCGESEVFEFMQSVQDQPVVDKPPWEVYVIPNFIYPKNKSSYAEDATKSSDKKSHYAVIFRIHHAIMDGISTGQILHSVMADEPFKFSVDPIDPLEGKNPSKLKTFLVYFLGFLSVPRVALKNLLLTDNQNNRFFKPGPTLTGPKTFTWSRPIKMEGLKLLKNSTKSSVFNVLLTSLGGAYRRLCLKNGSAPTTDFFHAMSPVALLPYPDRKPRNGFSAILVPVFVGKGQSILERLEVNHDNIKRLGSTVGSSYVLGNYYFPMFLGVMPLVLQKMFSSLMHVKMSLSNVPGPKEKVRIYDGGKIVDIGIWLPIKLSVGLGMGLFSYGDRVRATVIGDKVYFPNECDVQFLADAFEKELNSIAEAIGLPEDMLFIAD